MTSPRRRKKSAGHGEEHISERWLVSYADMITVLMCLFLVLFAMSTIDAAKYEQLKDSLATGFGVDPSDNVDSAVGVIVKPEYADGTGFAGTASDPSDIELAMAEVENFDALIAQIDANLTAEGLQDQVDYEVDERGLSIKLIGGQAYFAGDSAVLEPTAVRAIDAIGAALRPISNTISVEGHIDPYGQGSPFLNDWELAGDRSVRVLRHLVENGTIPAERISAVSYGGVDPVITEESALNRRVDIVVLTNLPATAAELVPGVVAAAASETAAAH
jgi:chemotaxis protein MotB